MTCTDHEHYYTNCVKNKSMPDQFENGTSAWVALASASDFYILLVHKYSKKNENMLQHDFNTNDF